MIVAIISDGIMNDKIRINKFGEQIADGWVGAVFLVYSIPLVEMAYIQFYVFSGVSGYSLLPEFSETLAMIIAIMIIPGTVVGWIAIKFAKRKISIPKII